MSDTSAIVPQATLERYHAEQKAFFAEQTRFNAKIMEMLAERKEADIKLDARLDAGARTFDQLREKIAELRPVPVPWTQKLALAVTVLGLLGGIIVTLARMPSADELQRLSQSVMTIQMEQVRVRAQLEFTKVHVP